MAEAVVLKVILVGESGVGKSCLLHRFLHGRFPPDQGPTIGVEFGARVLSVRGTTAKLQVWDTAGAERYRSVTRSYYRGASAALVVFDVNSRASYEGLPQWLEAVRT
eukprot:RCo051066